MTWIPSSKLIKGSLFSLTQEKIESEEQKKSGSSSGEDPQAYAHSKLVFTAVEVWKKNKVFGNGIKSFRFECLKIISEKKRGLCSTIIIISRY